MEPPAFASSWQHDGLNELLEEPTVMRVRADQCMYGLTTPGPDRRTPMPAMKPTAFLSNSWCVLSELSKICDHSHQHQHLMGGRARDAAIDPRLLCEAIARGYARQKKYDVRGKSCTGNLDKMRLNL